MYDFNNKRRTNPIVLVLGYLFGVFITVVKYRYFIVTFHTGSDMLK